MFSIQHIARLMFWISGFGMLAANTFEQRQGIVRGCVQPAYPVPPTLPFFESQWLFVPYAIFLACIVMVGFTHQNIIRLSIWMSAVLTIVSIAPIDLFRGRWDWDYAESYVVIAVTFSVVWIPVLMLMVVGGLLQMHFVGRKNVVASSALDQAC